MKLIQLLLVAAGLFCTAALAGGPTWNPIPITPPTGNYYQQPTAPDYAGNVSRGFSQMQDALRQYERTRPEPQPQRYSFKDGSSGVMVDATTMYVTAIDGTPFICTFVNGMRSDCNRTR